MKKIFRNIFNILIVGLLLITACTDDWEEMNSDPNNPTEVPATNLLAHGIRYFADFAYDDWFNMNNTSTYAGHLGKIQYIDESRYFERESVINTHWRDTYRVVMDMEQAKAFARAEGNVNLEAAALTFQTFVFSIATDSWRDLPFTEAISGLDGISSPAYDLQEDIYPALIDSLAKANEMFALGETGSLGDGDILFTGDISLWQKFANSLRLRLANRISAVSTEAMGVRDAILADPTTYPVMQSNDDNAFLYWPGSAPYEEPWAENSLTDGRDDHAMGSYLVDYMLSTTDPRLEVYAYQNEDGAYVGVVPGIEDTDVGNIAQYSRIGERFRGDVDGFTPFMRYCEVKFIEAEATGSQAIFEEAIVASCVENGIDQADAETFAAGFTLASDLFYQKWVSLFKQGHEAWAECRRTDVPVMSQAPGSRFPGHDRPPFRFAYPTDEANLNGANSQPYRDEVVDRFWGKKMWWDTRSGIQ